MRSIELKTLDGLSYKDVLTEVIRRPLDPQKGVDIQEMRRSVQVLDALESANGTLELTDPQYEVLKAKTEAMSWSVVDKRLLDLIDEVLGA